MKALITLIVLTFSVNSFANSIAATSVLTWYTTTAPSSMDQKAAAQTLQDAEEFHQSGRMSVKLAQEVSDLQSQLVVSNSEAVDLLTDRASEILN